MEYLDKLRRLKAEGKPCCGGASGGSFSRWTDVFKKIRWKSCATRCSRLLLIAINFVFLGIGGALVAVGLKVYLDQKSSIYVQIFTELPALGAVVDVEKIPLIFVAVGAFIALVSFLGCCGACSDSVCFLSLYTFLLLAALLSQIIFSALAVVYQQTILQNLEKSMQRQIKTEYNKTAKPWNLTSPRINHITMTWDIFQIRFNCCGAVGPLDYRFSAWFNESTSPDGVFVPPSCCVLDNDDFREPKVRDDDNCQIQAIVLKDESGPESHMPPSYISPPNYIFPPNYRSHSVVAHSDPPMFDGRNLLPAQLKYQGCQQSLIRWLRPKMVVVVFVTCATALLQVVHFMFACVLMTSLKKSHTECRWYDEDCE